jgi:hypothetical protein
MAINQEWESSGSGRKIARPADLFTIQLAHELYRTRREQISSTNGEADRRIAATSGPPKPRLWQRAESAIAMK